MATTASAQTKLGEISLGSSASDRCTGAEFNGDYLYCSLFENGIQVVVDVSTPSAPAISSTFDPAFGDQWHDPLYFNGSLYTGNRFGGLNRLDATSLGFLSQAASVNTLYHWKGLIGQTHGGVDYLYYSEAAAFGQGGGLIIYDANTLNPISQAIYTDAAGSDIAATTDGNWVFQLDNGDRISTREEVRMNVYDISNKSAPTRCTQFAMGNDINYRRAIYDLILNRNETHVFLCAGEDGLRIIDVTNPCSPVLCATANKSSSRVEGITAYRGDTVIVTAWVPSLSKHVLGVVDMSNPCRPKLLNKFIPDMDFIYDVEVEPASPYRFYVVGKKGGLPHMQVWQ